MQQEKYEQIKYSKQISTIIRKGILEYLAKIKLSDIEVKVIKLTFGLSEKKMSISEIMVFLNISKIQIDKILRNLFNYFRDTNIGEYIGEIIYGGYELADEKIPNKKMSKTNTLQAINNIIEYFMASPYNFSEEIINIIIRSLSVKEITLLNKRFGGNYRNPEMLCDLSQEEINDFRHILSKIEKRLQKSKNKMLENQEYLSSLAKRYGIITVKLILRILQDEESIQVLGNLQSELITRISDNEYSVADSVLNINKIRAEQLADMIIENPYFVIPIDDILTSLSIFVLGTLPLEYQKIDGEPIYESQLYVQIYTCLNKNLKYLESITAYYEINSRVLEKNRISKLFGLNNTYIAASTIKFFDTTKYIIACVKHNQREFKDIKFTSNIKP